MPVPPMPARRAPALVVHMAIGGVVDGLPTDGDDRHIAVPIRPRPGPLSGCDLTVVHGRLALLSALARREMAPTSVPLVLHTRSDRLEAVASASGRVNRVTSARTPRQWVDLTDAVLGPLSAEAPVAGPADGVVRLRSVATRAFGAKLLVARPGPERPVEELAGSGPTLWVLFGRGFTIRETSEELADRTGTPVDEVERAVAQFAERLVECGLADLG